MKKLILAACLTFGLAGGAQAATIFGVDENNNLVTFDSASPGTTRSSVRLTGLDSSLQAIDFRPLNNVLYGVSADRIVYTINTISGAATAITGALAIEGSVFGFDFNPTIDRIRLVTNTNNNYVVNPNDGSLTVATPLAYSAGDANAGRDPGVSGAAYTSSTFGAAAGTTQLYSIDTDLDVLTTQNNNGGVLNTVGALGVDLGSRTSFDISGADAFAFNGTSLYNINLGTGRLSLIGNTDRALFGIAVAGAVPEPATWAMMLLGFGAIGYSMRRRRATVRIARAA